MRSLLNICLAATCLTLVFVAGSRKPSPTSPVARVEQTEYEPAVSRASRDRTQVLLVFGARWCVWCQKFTRDVMPNQRIAARLAEKGISVVKVDVDARPDIASQYGVRSIPTLVLVDGDEREVRRLSGYATVREFLSWVD